MEEADNNGCERGCTGGCNCDGNTVIAGDTNVVPGEEVRSQYGKAVASAAIKEMHQDRGKDPDTGGCYVDDAEVKAFIAECSKSGEDVAKIVGHIAEREGIDLTAKVPKDHDKARLWSFLRAVLKTWVVDIAQFAANEIATGHFDWKSFVWDYVSDKLGGKKQVGEENSGKVPAKAIPVKAQDDVPSWVMALRLVILVPSIFPIILHRYVVVR